MSSQENLEALIAERTAQLSQLTDRLGQQLHFLEQLIEAIPGPVFYKDADGRYLGVNSACEAYLGRKREELIGKSVYDISPPDLAERYAAADRALFATRGQQVYEAQVAYADGVRRDVMFHKATFNRPDGELGGLIGVILDITDRKAMEQRLALHAKVFDSSSEGFLIADGNAKVIAINAAFTALTDMDETAVLGRYVPDLLERQPDPAIGAVMLKAAQRDGQWQGEIHNRRPGGGFRTLWITLTALRDGDGGTISHYIAVLSNVSALKSAQAKLDYQAHHDPLTGLPNRALLGKRLDGALQKARAAGSELALLFVDLDRFKTINDSLGHAVGDQVLREVAGRFGAALPERDAVVRFGGDEFVIVVEQVTERAAVERVAQAVIDQITAPIVVNGQELFVGASIGIALFPHDADDAAGLLQRADAAMYHAKDRGRDGYEFATDIGAPSSLQRLQLEVALRRGIERNEFRLVLQPQINLGSGQISSVEVLLRWQHPEHGLLAPDQFIALAEESGLIVPLGEWVMREACRLWAEWYDGRDDFPSIAVNVSAIEFRRGEVAASVRSALAASGLPSHLLEIELTESALMREADGGTAALDELRATGVRLAIDDFGTGYSSLAYLKRLPLHKLKIDRGFVRGLPDDAEDVAIARAIIGLARALQLLVVAEGVETEPQRDFLAAAGCYEIQGYIFSRPLPPADFHSAYIAPRARPS